MSHPAISRQHISRFSLRILRGQSQIWQIPMLMVQSILMQYWNACEIWLIPMTSEPDPFRHLFR